MPVIRPLIRPALIVGLGLAAIAGGTPALAGADRGPATNIVSDAPSLVPFIPGAPQPQVLDGLGPGGGGRPRWFGRLHVEMDIPQACAIRAIFGVEIAVRCSSDIPFLAGLTSDADRDFESTLTFTPGPDAHAPLGNALLVQIHAQRLTVDY